MFIVIERTCVHRVYMKQSTISTYKSIKLSLILGHGLEIQSDTWILSIDCYIVMIKSISVSNNYLDRPWATIPASEG